jgi:hypothetical protein
MISEIQTLLDKYLAWLREKTIIRQIDEWVEITTPFLDRHNDHLQIYVQRRNSGFVLSDDGYIIQDLIASSCSLESPKRQSLLNNTLNGYGIKLVENRLETHATAENFSLKKHN